MRTKKAILLIILGLISLSLIGCNSYSKEEIELIDFIKDFYNIQYEAYSNFEYCDIEPYLDMDKIQNQNKVLASMKMIIENKHLDEMKYCYIDRTINPIGYEINEININGNYASINVDLELTEGKFYPEFICQGENKFVLKKIDDNWKIVNHGYDGLIYFEKSDRELLPEIDEARIRKIIDNEYGKSPLSP